MASAGKEQRRLRDETSRTAFAKFRADVAGARENIGFSGANKASFGAYAGDDCLYRGHSSGEYKLLPTLLRATANKFGNNALPEVQDLEAQLFYDFMPRGRKVVPDVVSDWDMLFLMRHHMVATRLLDWTESLGVALYFALHPWLNDHGLRESVAGAHATSENWTSPVVWLVNPLRLNVISWGYEDIVAPRFLGEEDTSYGDWLGDFSDPGMSWDLPVAIFPERLNDRMHAQRGLFTIHGNRHVPLENLVRKDVLCKVPIPREALPAALEFLSDSGISESSLFPDLDALARDIHRKYGL